MKCWALRSGLAARAVRRARGRSESEGDRGAVRDAGQDDQVQWSAVDHLDVGLSPDKGLYDKAVEAAQTAAPQRHKVRLKGGGVGQCKS